MVEDILARAVRLLARREHSGAELAQKLAARGFSAEQIERAIAQLCGKNLLSDFRFAAAYVRQKRGQFGDTRVRLELRARGVNDDDIETALREDDSASEQERAIALLAKKFRGGVAEADKAKAMRFLRLRGFTVADGISAIAALRATAKK